MSRTGRFALPLVAGLAAFGAVGRAQDMSIERLATCQVSWLESKDDPTKLKALGEGLRASFTQKGNDPYLTPKSKATIAGLPVVRLFPESLGMGVGFSAIVSADFATARKAFEKAAGHSLSKCEKGDGMNSCAAELAPKKTLMVMSDEAGKSKETLVGCYYYYEK